MNGNGLQRRYDPALPIALTGDVFHFLLSMLGAQGVEDLDWSEAIEPPTSADDFAREVIFVICNSGMKNTVAAGIFAKCMAAPESGVEVRQVFRHPGKSAAIARIWAERDALYRNFQGATDQLEFLVGLPWIGEITKFHLAKNFGVDVAKPDVHLQRLADRDGTTPQALCARLAGEVGLRIATVDTILWRACANGVIDSRTGLIPSIQHLNDVRALQDGAATGERRDP